MKDNDSDQNNIPGETEDSSTAVRSSMGMSPYATGGGGVTFERRVAVQYLAHLLLGDGATEFGEDRRAVSVAFQQAPDYPVDDLVVCAARQDEAEPSLELSIAVRRSPNLVLSDEPTRNLIKDYVRAVINLPADGPEVRFGLVVAGPQEHAKQLETLSELALTQKDADGFFGLVHTPNKFPAALRGRLDQLENLVERALQDSGVNGLDSVLVRLRTWQLLSRLTVLMPRLESPDETDWSTIGNSLVPVARTHDLSGAGQLRDRLLALASDYSPKAAGVDLTLLRRDVHGSLDAHYRHHQQGWRILNHLHSVALESVRDGVTGRDGVSRWHLDRSRAAAGLVAVAAESEAVIVEGESGVGKSALALEAFCTGDQDEVQALCINLRQVPCLSVDVEDKLGLPLSTLMGELSAPLRLLVIDAADAVIEDREDAFRYMVAAAAVSEVKVVAVSSMDSLPVVHDLLTDCFGSGVGKFSVAPLSDSELEDMVRTFPELEGLNANPQSRELLRRLVVVDLLVRGHPDGVPLTEADAMQEVWSGLVRRRGRQDRGLPDSRESVLLQMASLSLNDGDRLDVISRLDPAAVAGLRQDGLLQTSIDNPFITGPDFAHDEVRRYAIARLLLIDGDPAACLLKAKAPRWALGAARLACQALLQQPDTPSMPLRGRFDDLQTAFDGLGEERHETRWGDVPSEALITLADSSPVIRDAWSKLRSNDDFGLKRLARLAGQRHRDDKGVINLNVIEPIVPFLLDDSAPWSAGEYASDLLREWLYGHVMAGTAAGHHLRTLLRGRLVEAYKEGDRRLQVRLRAEEEARAARTVEDIERERRSMEMDLLLFPRTGHGGRRRRRPEVPYECRDEVFVDLLALLGPDLGDEGEAILLRIARDAPSFLGPAVDELLTARAISCYDPGLLASLTQAYYLDDDADGSSTFDDGIRHHHPRRGELYLPLTAWFRGPFMALFRTDFRRGVAVLNRLLNHAARVRASKLARLHSRCNSIDYVDIAQYSAELSITGRSSIFLGDENVWKWYRGTGVGPYPCMSALQALELVCDQMLEAGAPVGTLVSVLLEGCENLAMVALAVGLLVRHLEVAGDLLDPYFSEPLIWRHEFGRIVDEHGLLEASSEGITSPERRGWSLREAAIATALRADEERVAVLLAVGETLVDRARSSIERNRDAEPTLDYGLGNTEMDMELATVKAWASCLDRAGLRVHETPEGTYIRATPPEEVVQALEDGSEEAGLAEEAVRLLVRYNVRRAEMGAETVDPDGLAADLESAHRLLDAPPPFVAHRPWDVPALVAAAVLEAYFVRCADVPIQALKLAADTVLRVSEDEAPRGLFDYEGTHFEQGADRSAARALPLLLTPAAEPLRTLIDGSDGLTAFRRISAAGLKLAQAVANEVGLHLARGLDHLWAAPCVQEGPCHHQAGWRIISETLRGCALGKWKPDVGGREIVLLEDPLSESLTAVPGDSLVLSRLDAAIRALAPASTADICLATSAGDLLRVVLSAQRRCMLAYESKSLHHRGDHSLVSARALLTLAQRGEDAPLFEHINAIAANSVLLFDLLRALSTAAEETRDRASTARRIWPGVIHHVLDLHNSGLTAFQEEFYGELALAALLPNAAPENGYMYREIQDKPIVWWEPLELESEVVSWLGLSAGKVHCVDQLVGFLRVLSAEDQVRVGLSWVETLVLESPGRIATRCFLLTNWLIETHSTAVTTGLLVRWQKIVDALVVEGVAQLAPYSQ